MAQYRKKPVVIEAVRWEPTLTTKDAELPHWLVMSNYDIGPGNSLLIKTREGTMRADPGDWIIRGVKGELYPIKDDIFRQTYEIVDAT